jgi:CHAT domain-containing protein
LLAAAFAVCGGDAITAYTGALGLAKQNQAGPALDQLKEVVRDSPCFGRAYKKLVALSARTGRLPEAGAYLQSLPAENGCRHYGLAVYFRTVEQLDRAAGEVRESLRSAPDFLPAYAELVDLEVRRKRLAEVESLLNAQLATGMRRGAVHYGLAYLYATREEWAKALEQLEKAAELRPEEWDIEEQRYFAYYQTDRLEEVAATLDRMLRIAAGDPEREGTVLGRKGMAYSDVGEYEKALPLLRRGIDLTGAIGDLKQEEIFRGNVSTVHAGLARYDDALAECREALRLARELGLAQDEGRNLGLLANIQTQMANYGEAIDSYMAALANARKNGDRASEAGQLGNLSEVYSALGETDRALQLIGQALGLSVELKNPWIEGGLLEIRGLLLAKLSRYAAAYRSYAAALRLARKIGDKAGEASRLSYIAEVDAQLGRYTAARAHLRNAVQIARGLSARAIEGRILVNLGKVHLHLGDLNSARASYANALDIGDGSGMPEISWRALNGLAQVAESSARMEEAREWNRRAVDAIEVVRGRLSLPEEKAGFLETKIQAYKLQIHLLLAGARGTARMTEAFEWAERAQARSFLDSIAESRLAVGGISDAELSARQSEVEAQLAQLQARIYAAYSRPSPDSGLVQRLKSELARAQEQYIDLRRDIRRRAPNFAAFRYPEPANFRAAQLLISDNSVILEFTLGPQSSFLFVIGRSEQKVFQLPSQAAIEHRVKGLRQAISAGPSRTGFGNFVLQAAELGRQLLGPALPLLAGKRELIIVPDGALRYLPFGALLVPGRAIDPNASAGQLPYLVREYSIRYAPSISVIAALRARPVREPAPGEKIMLAVGDPLYEGPSATATRGLSYARLAKPGRLLQSSREVEAIAGLYPATVVTKLMRREANKDTVKANIRGQRIFHFAVHAFVDEDNPEFSGLLLGRTNRSAAADSGMLQVYEILSLKMNADLVVLSGCQTGLGKRLEGEGLVGLTQAFLYAGARALVVSLWNIHDRSTAELMIHFYQRMREGVKPPDALRAAQVALIQEGEFAHPYFWSAFSVVGDAD